VKRGRGEDGIDLLARAQAKLREVACADVRAVPKLGAGALDHVRRRVDGDHVPARQAVEQELRDAARATAGVEHGLVAAQLEAVEDLHRHLDERVGDAVVLVGVPVADRRAHASAVVTGPLRSRSRS
jgi:hypothetical protein